MSLVSVTRMASHATGMHSLGLFGIPGSNRRSISSMVVKGVRCYHITSCSDLGVKELNTTSKATMETTTMMTENHFGGRLRQQRMVLPKIRSYCSTSMVHSQSTTTITGFGGGGGGFSSNSGSSSGGGGSNTGGYSSNTVTGTVKFYLRDKGYGFVVADGRGDMDLFVHRSAIQCSIPLSQAVIDSTVRYPYLKQNERVRFTIITENGMNKATNVTWLNGQAIPPERTNYLGGVYERAKRIFGETVYDYINQGGKDMLPIKQAYATCQRSIEQAETILQHLGMNVADFPTIKSQQGRGRYLFADGAATQQQTSPTKTMEDDEDNTTEQDDAFLQGFTMNGNPNDNNQGNENSSNDMMGTTATREDSSPFGNNDYPSSVPKP